MTGTESQEPSAEHAPLYHSVCTYWHKCHQSVCQCWLSRCSRRNGFSRLFTIGRRRRTDLAMKTRTHKHTWTQQAHSNGPDGHAGRRRSGRFEHHHSALTPASNHRFAIYNSVVVSIHWSSLAYTQTAICPSQQSEGKKRSTVSEI